MHAGKADEPIAIRLLKRFASDKEMEMLKAGKLALPEEKVRRAGRQKGRRHRRRPGRTDRGQRPGRRAVSRSRSTKRCAAAGGMLRYGIPEYRLPKKVLDHEIEIIRRKRRQVRL